MPILEISVIEALCVIDIVLHSSIMIFSYKIDRLLISVESPSFVKLMMTVNTFSRPPPPSRVLLYYPSQNAFISSSRIQYKHYTSTKSKSNTHCLLEDYR
jgi:hypothetical protein